MKRTKGLILKKIGIYLGFGVTVLLLALAAVTLITPRFGWRIDAVLSASMEPVIKVGSIVVARPVDIDQIHVGDVITFRSPLNGKFTTHRVISILTNPSPLIHTKGDANESPDPFILGTKSIAGKVYLNVAGMGYIIHFIKGRLGLLLFLYVPGFVIIITEMINIRRIICGPGIIQPRRGYV